MINLVVYFISIKMQHNNSSPKLRSLKKARNNWKQTITTESPINKPNVTIDAGKRAQDKVFNLSAKKSRVIHSPPGARESSTVASQLYVDKDERIEMLTSDIKTLQSQLNKQTQLEQQLYRQIGQLKGELAARDLKLNELSKKHEESEAQVALFDRELKELRDRHEIELQRQNERYGRELADLRAMLDNYRNSIISL